MTHEVVENLREMKKFQEKVNFLQPKEIETPPQQQQMIKVFITLSSIEG